jgi:LuxR family maltose regulon positive regulatory protein
MTNELENLKNFLPVTKFQAPTTQDTIKRVTLVQQLYSAVTKHRLTLISAPAGSGKTTLAADMVHAASEATVKWLSVDEGDNDLRAFGVAILLTTLGQPESDLLTVVQQGQMQPRQLATIIINRLAEQSTTPFILVLDDLHLVTELAIHEYLDYFIERLPAHVHILVITRYDPPIALAKLRARKDLAEIRMDSLRFNRQEVHALLNQLLHLNISDTLIDLMIERTEGWIAGLHLLALSLKTIDVGNREKYITDLAQNDRYVFDLLAEEVLAQQCDDIRQFLLETSILDELTPELCAAVTQQNDAVNTLRELHRNNLFLVSLGTGAYRYHALFRDFLLEQLKGSDRERIKQLHHRAAKAHGSRNQKINHFIFAESWDDVIRLMSEIAMANAGAFIGSRLGTMIKRIPDNLQEQNPWLLIIRGGLLIEQGRHRLGLPLIDKARDLCKQQGDIVGEILALALKVGAQPNTPYEEYVEIFDQFQDLLWDISPELQIALLIVAMWNGVWNYQIERAEYYLVEYINRVIQHDNLVTYRTTAQYIAEPLFCTSKGSQPFDRVLPHIAKYGENNTMIQMGIYNIRAVLAIFRGELDKGQHWLTLSNEINLYYGGFGWVSTLIYGLLLTISLVKRDIASFDRYYDEAMQLFSQQDTAGMKLAEFLYLRGRRLLQEGRIDEAQHIAENMREYIIVKEHEKLSLALQGHIAQAIGDLDKALDLMQQTVDYNLPVYQLTASYTLPFSLALIQWQQGEHDLALQTFHEALKPLVAWDYPGIAVQGGRETIPLFEATMNTGIYPDFCLTCINILHSADQTRPVDIPDSTETLTPREVEILREIVAGASNKEIAEALFISRNTVKSHITRILGKFNAKSRTEAIARVRELGISL